MREGVRITVTPRIGKRIGDWGLGIGDWGLKRFYNYVAFCDFRLPIEVQKTQSPIPNPQSRWWLHLNLRDHKVPGAFAGPIPRI